MAGRCTNNLQGLKLDHLPVELVQIICSFLQNSNDVLALRQVNRFCHSCTTRPLASHLKLKLNSFRAFTTEEGLKTVLDITSIPEWKDYIRCVELVDYGLETLQYSQKPHDSEKFNRWFGFFKIVSPQLDTIVNKV